MRRQPKLARVSIELSPVLGSNSPDTQAIAYRHRHAEQSNHREAALTIPGPCKSRGECGRASTAQITSPLSISDARYGISEAQFNDELRRIGETYKSEYEIAKHRQAELEKAVAAAVSQSQETSQALTTLRDLESSAETYRGSV